MKYFLRYKVDIVYCSLQEEMLKFYSDSTIKVWIMRHQVDCTFCMQWKEQYGTLLKASRHQNSVCWVLSPID